MQHRCIMIWLRRALFWVGVLLAVVGVWLLLPVEPDFYQNASTNMPDVSLSVERETDYRGWVAIALAALALVSSHYFKLREARRADRAEAREIADRRRRGEDTH